MFRRRASKRVEGMPNFLSAKVRLGNGEIHRSLDGFGDRAKERLDGAPWLADRSRHHASHPSRWQLRRRILQPGRCRPAESSFHHPIPKCHRDRWDFAQDRRRDRGSLQHLRIGSPDWTHYPMPLHVHAETTAPYPTPEFNIVHPIPRYRRQGSFLRTTQSSYVRDRKPLRSRHAPTGRYLAFVSRAALPSDPPTSKQTLRTERNALPANVARKD